MRSSSRRGHVRFEIVQSLFSRSLARSLDTLRKSPFEHMHLVPVGNVSPFQLIPARTPLFNCSSPFLFSRRLLFVRKYVRRHRYSEAAAVAALPPMNDSAQSTIYHRVHSVI